MFTKGNKDTIFPIEILSLEASRTSVAIDRVTVCLLVSSW